MMNQKKSYLPPDFLEEAKNYLLSEEKRLVEEERKLAEQDPFLVAERDVDNAETLDEAGEQTGHERVAAEREAVKRLLDETRLALSKLKAGRYGICDECGEMIDQARLKAHPQAQYCLRCENKLQGEGTP